MRVLLLLDGGLLEVGEGSSGSSILLGAVDGEELLVLLEMLRNEGEGCGRRDLWCGWACWRQERRAPGPLEGKDRRRGRQRRGKRAADEQRNTISTSLVAKTKGRDTDDDWAAAESRLARWSDAIVIWVREEGGR